MFSSVLHRNERRYGARSVARCEVQRQCGVAESEALAVGRDHITFWFGPWLFVAVEQIPIHSRQNDTRSETILQELRASRMVNVTMAHEYVSDFRWVQSELFQTIDGFILDRVIPQRVHDNDAVRCCHGPGGVFRLADEVEIVEDLYRLRMPLGTIGRTFRLACGGLLCLKRTHPIK